MLVNWFTVAAQIINFLILLYLLKRFLYAPILSAMEARKEKIENRWQDAENKEEAARQEREKFHTQLQEIDKERKTILEKAEHEAAGRKEELLAEAREQVAVQSKRWQDSLASQKEQFLKELRRECIKQALNLSKLFLQEVADVDLSEKIARRLILQINDSPEEEKKRLKDSIKSANYEVSVLSGSPLRPTVQEKLNDELNKIFKKEVIVQFETDPAVLGAQLLAGGYRSAWDLDSYLEEVTDHIQEKFKKIEMRVGE